MSEFTAAGGVGNGGANGLAYNPAGSNPVYTLTAKNVIFTPGTPVFRTVAATAPFGAHSVNQNFTMPHVINYNSTFSVNSLQERCCKRDLSEAKAASPLDGLCRKPKGHAWYGGANA